VVVVAKNRRDDGGGPWVTGEHGGFFCWLPAIVKKESRIHELPIGKKEARKERLCVCGCRFLEGEIRVHNLQFWSLHFKESFK
jgi:hypothetical protein